ncbi:MAG: GyrI-like domain-containing protein, partial [Gammaproteobacteria bacterium]|nr:GyrI-like domain-containing protein [Gammaproteobacteria bacterium]
GLSDAAAGIVCKTIPAGRCAVLRHIGSDESLGNSIRFLYSEWLPQSGEEPRNFPIYLQRVKFFPDVAEHESITDIFLPIR